MAKTTIPGGYIQDNSVGIDALNVTDGTNGQYLQTDGSGTLSFASATVSDISDLTATATELNYLDGVTGITLGSANELLVVGGDGSSIVSDSTLAVDTSNNRLGINQSSPEVTLHMTGEGAQTAQIRMEQYNDSADAPDLRTRRYRGTIASPSAISSGDYLYRSNHEYWNGSALIVGGTFAFDNTNNANRTQFAVSVTTDGTSADANTPSKVQFKIDGNDSGAITFNNAYKFPTSDGSANQVLTTDGSGTLSFADSAGGVDGIVSSANATAITIDSSENVGIGATTIDEKLHIEVSSGDAAIKLEDASGDFVRIDQNSVGANDKIRFKTGSNLDERMRIDSSGRVGINRTPAITNSKLEIGGADNVPLINVEASGATAGIGIGAQSGSSAMRFYYGTTERASLNLHGAWKVKSTSGAYFNSVSKYHEINSDDSALTTVLIRNGSTYYANCANFWLYGGAPNNTQSQFWTCNDTAGQKASIQSNGGLHNYQSNNSNLCDEREKKNIEVLSSTWNSVKSWELKKFHYNEDEDSDDKRLGVIAQEIQIINPELITEHTKVQAKDEVLWTEEDDLPEGVSVGDTRTAAQDAVIRKGVKEQQMYIMAIKALQEAMTEIEDLKARIETLENP
jgi:hypothetical protein